MQIQKSIQDTFCSGGENEGGLGWEAEGGIEGWREVRGWGWRCVSSSGSSLASMLRPALWQIATILEGAGSNELLGVPR